ncbi:MAG: hypothetical protein LBK71_09935, partial [Verrucomicrobiales bacterium]|nr:hypothetical protein [Verrucomicrobiales bacterium]
MNPKLTLLTLCALSVCFAAKRLGIRASVYLLAYFTALNVFAQNKYVNSGTVTETGQTYESIANQAALQVISNQTLYQGTNITLSATFDTNNGRYGAYAGNYGRIELTDSAITTTGSGGRGVVLTGTATGALTRVVISTEGDGAHGILPDYHASVELNDVSITTSGSDADGIHGAYMNIPVVRFNNLTIVTYGENSQGIASEGSGTTLGTSFSGNGLRVTTHGWNAAGLQSSGGVVMDVTDFVIRTDGDRARGADRGNSRDSIWHLTSGTIETSGSGADGFMLHGYGGGETVFTDVVIRTTGTDAAGIYLSGLGNASSVEHGPVVFNGGSVTATQGLAVRIAGFQNPSLTFQAGAVVTGDVVAVDSGTNISGNYDYGYTLNLTDSTLDGAITNLSPGTDGLTVNLTQSAVTGDLTGSGTSLTVVTLDDSALTGDVTANDEAVIIITGSNGGVIIGDLTGNDNAVIDVIVSGSDSAILGDIAQNDDAAVTITLDTGATGQGGYHGGNLITGEDSTWTFNKNSHGNYGENHGVWNIGDYEVIFDNMTHTGTVNLSVNSDTGAGGSITVTGT